MARPANVACKVCFIDRSEDTCPQFVEAATALEKLSTEGVLNYLKRGLDRTRLGCLGLNWAV